LTPLLSGARSPKLTEAGSPNTAPKRRQVPGRISQRKMQKDERVNEGLILAYMEGMSDHTRLARGLWGMYERARPRTQGA
jgi:hypothetical protein